MSPVSSDYAIPHRHRRHHVVMLLLGFLMLNQLGDLCIGFLLAVAEGIERLPLPSHGRVRQGCHRFNCRGLAHCFRQHELAMAQPEMVPLSDHLGRHHPDLPLAQAKQRRRSWLRSSLRSVLKHRSRFNCKGLAHCFRQHEIAIAQPKTVPLSPHDHLGRLHHPELPLAQAKQRRTSWL